MRTSLWFAALAMVAMAAPLAGQPSAFPGAEWATGSPEAHGLDSGRLEAAARAASEIGGRQGFLVVKGGVIVHESYFEGDAETLHPAFSVAKGFGATLVGIAQMQGHLELSDRVDHWVPIHHPDIVPGATIEHLITHTAGSEPAGSVFRYTSGNILNTVPNILELATGMTPNEFFERELAAKIGLGFEWPHTERGWFQIGTQRVHGLGPVPMNHRDMARLGLLWLNKGNWNGEQLLDEAFIAAGTAAPFPDATRNYGYQWWLNGTSDEGTQRIPGAPSNVYHALGGSFQYIYVIPDHDIVVVTLGDPEVSESGQTQKLWNVIAGFLPEE